MPSKIWSKIRCHFWSIFDQFWPPKWSLKSIKIVKKESGEQLKRDIRAYLGPKCPPNDSNTTFWMLFGRFWMLFGWLFQDFGFLDSWIPEFLDSGDSEFPNSSIPIPAFLDSWISEFLNSWVPLSCLPFGFGGASAKLTCLSPRLHIIHMISEDSCSLVPTSPKYHSKMSSRAHFSCFWSLVLCYLASILKTFGLLWAP